MLGMLESGVIVKMNEYYKAYQDTLESITLILKAARLNIVELQDLDYINSKYSKGVKQAYEDIIEFVEHRINTY